MKKSHAPLKFYPLHTNQKINFTWPNTVFSCCCDLLDLNLLDWGNNGLIAVPLYNAIYLWNSETGSVDELFGDNPITDDNLSVTSVKWITEGLHLAVGLSNGTVEVSNTFISLLIHLLTASFFHPIRMGPSFVEACPSPEINWNKLCGGECDSCKYYLNRNSGLFSIDSCLKLWICTTWPYNVRHKMVRMTFQIQGKAGKKRKFREEKKEKKWRKKCKNKNPLQGIKDMLSNWKYIVHNTKEMLKTLIFLCVCVYVCVCVCVCGVMVYLLVNRKNG